MKTIRLYDDAPYSTEFKGVIKDIRQLDQTTEVILDQTLFFPEEGGQCADTGMLAGKRVIDVQTKNEVITHVLEGKLDMSIGEEVEGKIDWNLRFSNMQNHSGEHIFSGIVNKKFGYDNVGFHLGSDAVSVDFNGPISNEDLRLIENEVNQVIYDNRPITCSYPEEDALKDMNYRSKKELDTAVRIVEIEDCDVCACCAPHVRHTGEVGMFKIINAMNYKGGVRIFLLCGKRALEYVQNVDDHMKELYHLLSANDETVVKYVKALQDNNNALKAEISELKKKQMSAALEEVSGKNYYLFVEEMDKNIQREMVNEAMNKVEEYAGVFVGNDQSGYRFILGSATKDSVELFHLLKEKGAKGGGMKTMVQGFINASKEDIRMVIGE